MTNRIQRLKSRLAQEGIALLQVADHTDILYLTGSSISAGSLFVSAGRTVLVTDYRYVSQVRYECPWLTVIEYGIQGEHLAYFAALAQDYVGKRCLCDGGDPWAGMIPGITWENAQNLVSRMRSCKDAQELSLLRSACRMADAAYEHILSYLEFYGAGVGHGVGLTVAERPVLLDLPGLSCSEVLEAGNVVTVEPAIYLPGRFGVRVEDDLYVGQDGTENLMTSRKDLIELDF